MLKSLAKQQSHRHNLLNKQTTNLGGLPRRFPPTQLPSTQAIHPPTEANQAAPTCLPMHVSTCTGPLCMRALPSSLALVGWNISARPSSQPTHTADPELALAAAALLPLLFAPADGRGLEAVLVLGTRAMLRTPAGYSASVSCAQRKKRRVLCCCCDGRPLRNGAGE